MKRSEMKVASDALFALLESGPRNSAVMQIAERLRDGDETSARRLYEWDGDKIAMTIYQAEVQKHLGCRLHGKLDCEAFLCRANPSRQPRESASVGLDGVVGSPN